jgi:hypothetical protein
MKTRKIATKIKWGIIPHPEVPGHFFTGYVPFSDDERMEVGTNAIITHDFGIDCMKRGRSKANIIGHFRGHPEVPYSLSLSSTLDLLMLIQADIIRPVNGFLSGDWTFVKQGSDIFLAPYLRDDR